jgi:hypothetical protein
MIRTSKSMTLAWVPGLSSIEPNIFKGLRPYLASSTGAAATLGSIVALIVFGYSSGTTARGAAKSAQPPRRRRPNNERI